MADAKVPFDKLFTGEAARSYEGLIKDIRLAPGGVIVDAALPLTLIKAVLGARYDAASNHIQLDLGDRWLDVEPTVSRQTARAAWAMVLDGRVAAADIRSPDLTNRQLATNLLPITRLIQLTPLQTKQLADDLDYLRAVNLHPALIDTMVGSALVAADEVIFTVLRTEPQLKARDSVYHGVDVVPLRRALDEDLRELSAAYAIRDLKSILTARDPTVTTTASAVKLQFALRYEVFRLAEGTPTVLPRVHAWFTDHDRELQAASEELRDLVAFATASAVFRSVQRFGVPNDFDRLVLVSEAATTPRFLCRAEVRESCQLRNLRAVLN